MTPEENYADITEMQAEFHARCRDKRRWTIVEEDDGQYSITDLSRDGIGPCIIKPNKREVAARLLQCLQIGPVAPQDYPERVCVGEIKYASADVLPITDKPSKG